jgi:hypothetical protein
MVRDMSAYVNAVTLKALDAAAEAEAESSDSSAPLETKKISWRKVRSELANLGIKLS